MAQSAYKHGVRRVDLLHTFRNPVRAELLDDGLVMLSGADTSGGLLEVGYVETEDGPLIVHAMPARSKYLP